MKSKKTKSSARSARRRQPPSDLQLPESLRENAVIEELRQTVQRLRIFDSLGKTLTSSLDLSEILRILVEKLGSLVNCTHFGLVLLDGPSNEFFFAFPKEIAELKMSFPLGKGLVGRSLERGKGGLISEPTADPLFEEKIDGLILKNPSSMIIIPIMSKGSILGSLLFLTSKNEKAFTDEQNRMLETFSDYVAIAVENARNFNRVQELTITDDLTKLYNSRYLHLILERELARSERYKENLSLVFIDIDNFKSINDQHGHMHGSQLLQEFGDFLLKQIRTSDVAIRYGGDEFVLVLPRTNTKEALLFVNRARDALKSHVFLKSRHLTIRMTASFGIATYPEDGINVDQIISAADKAMYVVKRGNKDGVYAAGRPITLVGSSRKS